HRRPRPPLLPYTTLFRSHGDQRSALVAGTPTLASRARGGARERGNAESRLPDGLPCESQHGPHQQFMIRFLARQGQGQLRVKDWPGRSTSCAGISRPCTVSHPRPGPSLQFALRVTVTTLPAFDTSKLSIIEATVSPLQAG